MRDTLAQEDRLFVISHHALLQNSSPAYQLIVTDLDGTQLDTHGIITQPVADAIREATSAGIEVIIASGRNRPALEPVLQELGLETPHIGTGGAYLSCFDGRLLFHEPVPARYIPEIVKTTRRYGLGMGFFEVEATYLEGPPNWVQWMLEHYSSPGTRVVSDMLQAEIGPPGKIFLWGDIPPLLEAIKALKGRNLPLTLVRSLKNGYEINAAGVTKGRALKTYAELQGIPLDRVAAFGDQHNDLSMFTVAGLAVAMGNAPEAVRAAAHQVAPTNDQSGLAWGIRNLVLSNESSQAGMKEFKR